jgi:hypothetical protein
MTTDQINQMFQRAHFAAVLCGILGEWANEDVTHDDIRNFICKSLQRCSQYGVGDQIEEKLLQVANDYIDQHNTLVEVNQILNQ